MLTLLLLFIVVSASASDNCTCVPYYQCSEETGSLILDGKGLLDLRHFNKTECTGYFDVCCNVTNIAAIKTKKPKFRGCGYQNYGFSWLAAVLLKSATIDFHEYKCGASIIHKQAVITAAHCVRARDGVWQVRVGDHYFAIKKLIVHPNFNSGSLQNDISLIILENPIDIPMEYICVPPPGVEIQNERCTVIVPREKHPINMKIIELPIVSSDECQTKLRNTRLGSFFHLHDSFMCAGGETFEDVCGGDGGSPLICPVPAQPGRYHQVGIVSWGIGCGQNNAPGVYVKLAFFRDWIDSELKSNGFDINSYRY